VRACVQLRVPFQEADFGSRVCRLGYMTV
jgi:hypothetical protein